MKIVKKLTFLAFPLLITGHLSALTSAQVAELIQSPEIAQIIQDKIDAALQTAKSLPTESIADNFAGTKEHFIYGAHSLGLAASRLTRDCACSFSQLGDTMAKHYWIFGGLVTGGVIFYLYVLPHIKIRITYANDDRPEPCVQRR